MCVLLHISTAPKIEWGLMCRYTNCIKNVFRFFLFLIQFHCKATFPAYVLVFYPMRSITTPWSLLSSKINYNNKSNNTKCIFKYLSILYVFCCNAIVNFCTYSFLLSVFTYLYWQSIVVYSYVECPVLQYSLASLITM